MNQETVSVRLTDEKRRALDAITTDMQRDRSEVISEAINFGICILKTPNC